MTIFLKVEGEKPHVPRLRANRVLLVCDTVAPARKKEYIKELNGWHQLFL